MIKMLMLLGALLIPPTDDLDGAIHLAQMSQCGQASTGRLGCKIVLQNGVYRADKAIPICRSLIIEGEGGQFDPTTHVVFTSSTSGFIAHTGAECEALGYGAGSGAGRTALRDLYIENIHPLTVEDRTVGVRADRPVDLHNVGIENFMQGFRCSATAGSDGSPKDTFERGTGTNCNKSSLTNVRVTRSGHAGVWFQDKDSNAGYSLGLDTTNNCTLAPQLPAEMGQCAGFVQRSFLGHVDIASHHAQGNGYPLIFAQGANNGAVFVGPYAETGHGDNAYDKYMTVIGGRNVFNGTGLKIAGPLVSGMCDLKSEFCFGDRATTGAAAMMKFVLDGKNYYVRFKGKLLGGVPRLVLDINNLNAARILDVSLEPPQTVRFYHPHEDL